jgi:hypothetical protein
MRNDNITAAATVGSGDGSTAPEQYVAFNPNNLADAQPVQPGSTAILKSVQVGWQCCTWFVPAWVFETRSLGGVVPRFCMGCIRQRAGPPWLRAEQVLQECKRSAANRCLYAFVAVEWFD